jgi:hypothetical protein
VRYKRDGLRLLDAVFSSPASCGKAFRFVDASLVVWSIYDYQGPVCASLP